MFDVCPLCNGMISQELTCPNCLNPTIECGKRNDYTGPYAPYAGEEPENPNPFANIGTTEMASLNCTAPTCWHMTYCEACNHIAWIDGYQLYTDS